ncbi:TetR/AcrR family transcriptional regulator [Paraburkholderia sp. BL10I2N1]|uniref:TetR/AcrR family transcriptional regulator n=1 Tax=Paraburkholderia sp. BL10I2N1 TaxID=1938796 RepID=UPI001061C03C|nr:TetR/AcrR family transcriptional regulator [Paraburkholderia sp. BL10I2N1]TDN61406.1 TetR family transcriptional regulator [Paraburkholderia sp. BL10I2N1]
MAKKQASQTRTTARASVSADDIAPAEGRQLILDTAARLFRHEGYASTSLRDIAAECGVTTGSIYHHFGSKEEIVTEVLRIGVVRVAEEVRRAVMSLNPASDARTILHAAVFAHLHGMLELQDYTSANVRIFGQVPPSIREKHIVVRDAYETFWHKLLQRCASQGTFNPARDLRLTRLFLINALNGSLEWYRPEIASIQKLTHELTELFLDGLEARSRR